MFKKTYLLANWDRAEQCVANKKGTDCSWLRHSASLLVVLLLGANGCTDTVSPADADAIDARAFMTTEVVAQLTADGRLPNSLPPLDAPLMVTSSQASVLARAYVKSFGRYLVNTWSDEAQRTITESRLTPCDRLDFLESAYEFIPLSTSPNFRELHAGAWLVRFCDGGTAPVLEVSVSSAARPLPAVTDGVFGVGDIGDAIKASGVASRSYSTGRPDRAIEAGATRLNAKVNALPRLIHVGGQYVAQAAFWLLPVTETGSSRRFRGWAAVGRSGQVRVIAEDAVLPTVAGSDTLTDRTPSGAAISVVLRRRIDSPRILLDSVKAGALR